LHTLQLGLDPAGAVLVDLPDPRVALVLDLLDGARPERDVVDRAVQLGVPADDARALIDTLHDAGLVLGAHTLLPSTLADQARQRLSGEATALALRDAAHRRTAPGRPSSSRPSPHQPSPHQPSPDRSGPDRSSLSPSSTSRSGPGRSGPGQPGPGQSAAVRLTPAQVIRRRGAARVVIAGRGRLAAGIAVALAQAGVGQLSPDLIGHVTLADLPGSPLTAEDAGQSRQNAVTAALHRAVPGVDTRAIRRGAADLVLQLGHDQPVALLAAAHARRRQPHLAVTIREGTAIVGPLVPATGGPCLHCRDLHRTERDAAWPEIAAQLGAPAPEPCDVSTVLAATAYATAEVLTFLNGGAPETLGAAVEIAGPGRFRRRTWAPHPGCGCGRRRTRRIAA
jgi:hypothetical protein